MTLTSSAVGEGGTLPKRFTFGGGNRSIPVQWKGLPTGTRSVAIVMDDPDAVAVVGVTYVHWTLVDLPVSTVLTENGDGSLAAPARRGRNDGGGVGYEGPDPPSGNHTYRIRVYALSVSNLTIDLNRTWTRTAFQSAFSSSILGTAELSFRAGVSSAIWATLPAVGSPDREKHREDVRLATNAAGGVHVRF